MSFQVCTGATLICRFGSTSSQLQVIAPDRQVAPGKASATILDHQPSINIQPFGLCQSLTNPAVALVTTATVSLETLKPAQAEKNKVCGVCDKPVCSCLVSFLVPSLDVIAIFLFLCRASVGSNAARHTPLFLIFVSGGWRLTPYPPYLELQ